MSSNYQSSSAETIDTKLFLPLARFFIDLSQVQEEFIQHLLKHPSHRHGVRNVGAYRGHLFELYVKRILDKFAGTRADFNETRFRRMTVGRRHPFEYKKNGEVRRGTARLNHSGNLKFYSANGRSLAEIDALYEWRDDHRIVPVVFEMSYGNHLTNKKDFKMLALASFYALPAEICGVRPDFDVRKTFSECSHTRGIIVPHIDLDYVASRLWQEISSARQPKFATSN